jgi:hypothetical protein
MSAESQVKRKARSRRIGNTQKSGWRVDEWGHATGVCRASVFNLLRDGRISRVKLGSMTIITTQPAAFLASLRDDAAE